MSDFYGTDWSVLAQAGFLELAQRREFTGETWRVFATAIGMMDTPNRIAVRSVDIAEHLGIRPDAVTRQMKLLVATGVLKIGARYGWELTARYGFKGDPDKSLRRAPGGELVIIR